MKHGTNEREKKIKSRLIFALHLNDWEDHESFLDQSFSKEKQNQSRPSLLSKLKNSQRYSNP